MSDKGFPLDDEGDPDAALAGEFALGLLEPSEAASCAARIAREPAFARLVEDWQARFSALDDGFAPVPPPPGLERRIMARLFGREPSGLARLWGSAGLWRGLALASLAFAAYLGTLAPQPQAPTGEGAPRLISALAAVDSDVELLALLEPDAAVLSINRTSGAAAAGGALELWVIAGEEPPVSLGLLPEANFGRIPLSRELAAKIAAGATLAVSAEPAGGSPTGAPTGPVVAAGAVTEI